MSLLDRVVPINLLEEKAKFLADPSYDPQFVYEEIVETPLLEMYGYPQAKYLQLAQDILDKTYYGRNESDLLMMEGPLIDQAEVTKRFETFLKMHGLEKRYDIIWSSSFVSRATITSDTLKLRSTAEFRREGLIGLIYHEIGTHALRRINYEQQPWFKKRQENGLDTNYLRTEEGLASLHSLIPHGYKSMYNSAIRYMAVDYARTHSLRELWNFLGKYIQDLETRWMVTFRQKRGVTDTAQGGGFTKDIVYFEGAIEVWQWLKQHDFDPTLLYQGKISCQDTAKALALNPSYQPLLPCFYTLDPSDYQKNMMAIGEANNFNDLES